MKETILYQAEYIPLPWHESLLHDLLFAVVCVIPFILLAILLGKIKFKFFFQKENVIWGLSIFFAIMVLIFVHNASLPPPTYTNPYEIYAEGKCKVLEGVIENYHFVSDKGYDSFSVAGVNFCTAEGVGSYYGYGYPYNAKNGGVLKNGMHVRIQYIPRFDPDFNIIMEIVLLEPME